MILVPPPAPKAVSTLADRLDAARRSHFVGRNAQCERFVDAVEAADPPFAALFVHGPGGIGKTTLLGEYRHIAQRAGLRTITVDGHSCEPTPPAFLGIIARELKVADTTSCLDALAKVDRFVLLIDTWEVLQPLDGWLRNDFLPRLPATALTVIAGRTPPNDLWRTSPGWAELIEVQALRNLAPTDSRQYLTARGVPPSSHASVLAFTHGHPLALSLAGDVATRSGESFVPDREPDVVTSLLHHFVELEPSPMHRHALETCAIARITSETLLARMFGEEHAHNLYTWLHSLSFIEHDRHGVFPHDLARDVLVTELRWRHPDHYVELHRKIHDQIIDRVRHTTGQEQLQAVSTLMFLHRNNPTWQQIVPLDQYGHEYLEPATPADHAAILDIIQHHEGARSAEIADGWLQRQPENFVLFRDIHAEITGFGFRLEFGHLSPADVAFDPLVTQLFALMDRHGPVRPGEEAVCARFCMGRDHYRTPGLRLQFATIGSAYIYSHPRVAWMFTPVVDPDYWRPLLQYLHIESFPDFDVTFDGRTWTVFGHDWRVEPIEELDKIMVEKEMSLSPDLAPIRTSSAPVLVLLAEEDFRRAVRQALRDFHRSDELAANPLCRCRLIVEQNGGDPIETLRRLLRSAADQLDAGPRTRRYHDALQHTWFAPARTQEEAAEVLDIPFSTYRRHLASGLDHVTAELWRRELGNNNHP